MMKTKHLRKACLCAIPVFAAAVVFYAATAQAQTFSARGVQAIDSASGAALGGKVADLERTLNNIVVVSIPAIDDQFVAITEDISNLGNDLNSLEQRIESIEAKLDAIIDSLENTAIGSSSATAQANLSPGPSETQITQCAVPAISATGIDGHYPYQLPNGRVLSIRYDWRLPVIDGGTLVNSGATIVRYRHGSGGQGNIRPSGYVTYLCYSNGNFVAL